MAVPHRIFRIALGATCVHQVVEACLQLVGTLGDTAHMLHRRCGNSGRYAFASGAACTDSDTVVAETRVHCSSREERSRAETEWGRVPAGSAGYASGSNVFSFARQETARHSSLLSGFAALVLEVVSPSLVYCAGEDGGHTEQ